MFTAGLFFLVFEIVRQKLGLNLVVRLNFSAIQELFSLLLVSREGAVLNVESNLRYSSCLSTTDKLWFERANYNCELTQSTLFETSEVVGKISK